jgi:hypothetical protein
MRNFLRNCKMSVAITRAGIRIRAESVTAIIAAVLIVWIVFAAVA